jgi:hypothetical protein
VNRFVLRMGEECLPYTRRAASGLTDAKRRRLSANLLYRTHYHMYSIKQRAFTYDHRLRRTGDPVRSRILKPQIGRLVVGWVTTSEYLLLYVFYFFFRFSNYNLKFSASLVDSLLSLVSCLSPPSIWNFNIDIDIELLH